MMKLIQRRAAKKAAEQTFAMYTWRPSGPGR
jgi:hypothetical protein